MIVARTPRRSLMSVASGKANAKACASERFVRIGMIEQVLAGARMYFMTWIMLSFVDSGT